ncbi:Retinol dehydrogenase 13 [Labilithrix luteola]|uniref:Retinol dehydrogenase 13 n=1 Tax=Labilithrix luteola TaxID=1391654 RepID=A0A0K1Q1H4_9BACT|nr:SDR family oxidoreductase [Labilithrix luteola]AKU99628.1 Retinol dehydrogenase 13 [Labilithrix luteola]
MTSMLGKTVLITGANQGIGKASAAALGALGAKLVLVCRNEAKARAAIADIERAGAKNVDLIVADVGSQAEVRRIAREFKSKYDRLDVLLNNAGVLVTERRTTVDGIEETLAINHLAYFLLTNELLDMLERSGPSRVVNVASEAHRGVRKVNFDDLQFERGYRSFAAYSQSKLCNILFTRELARRVDSKKITVNSVHPGAIASGFGHTYGGFTSVVMKLARPFLKTPEKGAKTQIYLCSSPEVTGVTGQYFADCREKKPSRGARGDDDARTLWARSEELTKVSAKVDAA